jgi:hypothetical protein
MAECERGADEQDRDEQQLDRQHENGEDDGRQEDERHRDRDHDQHGGERVVERVREEVRQLVEPSGSLLGYVKEVGGARRNDGRAPDQPLRDRVER